MKFKTLAAAGLAASVSLAVISCGDDNNSDPCHVTRQSDGSAKITCSDGSEVVIPRGTNGADGTNGTNGTNCSVTENADGTATITCPDGSTAQVGSPAPGGSTIPAGVTPVSFSGVSFPSTDAEKRQALSKQSVTLGDKSADVEYNVLFRSGDAPGGAGTPRFGLMLDRNGDPVRAKDGSEFISNATDFSSIMKVGERIWSVTHFESRPGGMYLSELEQDKTTGKLTAKSTQNIDFSAVDGLWVPCAGSVTPWNTHLGGEEYPPDARLWFSRNPTDSVSTIRGYIQPHLRYYGVDIYTDSDNDGQANARVSDARAAFHPYMVGYPNEIKVAEDGSHTVVKHYSMGRVAIELAYVMPDQKTVYISDDGTNVGFFMFVADKAGDLSSGRLYALKWNQVSAQNGGRAEISWVPLDNASVTDTQVAAMRTSLTFDQIFESEAPNADGSCPTAGFRSISFTSLKSESGSECLRLRPNQEIAASRFETTRYAAYLGASTEFRKEEGITFNPATSTLYVAMSERGKGMEDNGKYDLGGPNHIRLAANKCGTVYEAKVGTDSAIGSDYVVKRMQALISGKPVEGDPKNKCDKDGIANPDNLTFMQGTDTLFIGEDTGSGHQNDAVWAYNVYTKKLTRVMTTPYGSETTSPYWYPNINGWAYLKTVIQHPYGESDQDALTDAAEAMAYDGYLGPFPAF